MQVFQTVRIEARVNGCVQGQQEVTVPQSSTTFASRKRSCAPKSGEEKKQRVTAGAFEQNSVQAICHELLVASGESGCQVRGPEQEQENLLAPVPLASFPEEEGLTGDPTEKSMTEENLYEGMPETKSLPEKPAVVAAQQEEQEEGSSVQQEGVGSVLAGDNQPAEPAELTEAVVRDALHKAGAVSQEYIIGFCQIRSGLVGSWQRERLSRIMYITGACT